MNPEDQKYFKPNPEAKSLFAQEAERMLKLNASKNQKVSIKERMGEIAIGVIIGLLIATFFFIPMVIYGILSTAFVASKLWIWFVVPIFHLPVIGILPFAGIALLIRVLSDSPPEPAESPNRNWKKHFAYIVGLMARPWVILLIGYIVHCFIS